MGRRLGKITLAVFMLLVLMQFYQPRQNADTPGDQPHSIEAVAKMPKDVKEILQRSCYDCHSNSTDYPWYSYVQPVGWWLESHITEGKEELNFSEFGNYSGRRQASKLESIAGQLRSGAMPPGSYTAIHGDAQLSRTEVQIVMEWVKSLQGSPPQE